MFKSLRVFFLCITLFFSLNAFAQSVDDMFKELNEYRLQQEKQDQEYARNAEITSRIAITEANNKNIVYLIVLAIPIVFLARNVVKAQQNAQLNRSQQFGIKIIVISGLMLVFVLMMSQPWTPQIDMMQNIFGYLRLQLFPVGDGTCTPWQVDCYSVDIPTKFIVFGLLCIAAYGLTTYLGITTYRPLLAKTDDLKQ